MASNHPALKGRVVQTFKSSMKKLTSGMLETQVARFLFNYQITPQKVTSVSPFKLLFGRHLCCHLDLLHPSMETKVHQNQYR